MLIFGGIFEVTKELNDLLAYDFSAKQWVTLFEELGPASTSPVRTNTKSITMEGGNSPIYNKMNSLHKKVGDTFKSNHGGPSDMPRP